MNELELLHKWTEAKQNLDILMIKQRYLKTEDEQYRHSNEISKAESEADKLKNALLEIHEKKYSKRSRELMIEQLEKYIYRINQKGGDLRLLKSQWTIIENHLFSLIANDLVHHVVDGTTWVNDPAYLFYTYEKGNHTVDILELTDFLKNEVDVIRNMKSVNYIELWNYYQSFLNRMRDKFF